MRSASNFIKKYNTKDNLDKNYEEALKDKDFKELVSSLNIDEKIKKQNTSKLETVVLESKISDKCKKNKRCLHPVEGFVYSVRVIDDKLDFYYEDCKYDLTNKNMILYDLPDNLKTASFKNIYLNDKKRAEVIKFLAEYQKNYDKRGKALYLSGSFGSGKTYLITALFNELGKEGIKSIVAHFPELLRSLKVFDDNYNDTFYKLKNVPLLLLDDIGAEYLTPWSRDEVLEPILDYRMNNNLATFFTSNYTLKELEEHLKLKGESDDVIKAKRIIERIKMLSTEKKLISKNLRGANG